MRDFINSFFFGYKKEECHASLSNNNEYYQLLSPKNKAIFVYRTIQFLKKIEISSTEKIELNKDMEYLIASAFIQLTFGYKSYRLRNFKKILIMHEAYSYENIGVLYFGDTNPKTEQINLVWKIVEKGFKIPDDSINLAIHEFAHALILDNKNRIFIRKLFSHRKLTRYFQTAKVEMHKIREGHYSIFRDYGAVNLMEFFAVSVEVFFEQPYDFARYNSLLYERLCLLLNQDPRKPQSSRL